MCERILKALALSVGALCPMFAAASGNLVLDGSTFDHFGKVIGVGGATWTSDYTYVNYGKDVLEIEGRITVGADANYVHHKDPATASDWAHVTSEDGDGKMLIVNGADRTKPDPTDPTKQVPLTVWTSSFLSPLSKGQTYEFSAWVSGVHTGSQAVLDFSIGGLLIKKDYLATFNKWTQVTATFSGNDLKSFSSANAIDMSIIRSGNDFAIDNIQVKAVPEPFTMLLGVAGIGLATRRRLSK